MPNGKSMAVLGIPLVAVAGMISGIGFLSATNHHTVDLPNLKVGMELALVRKFDGTPALEELLRSQGFKIEYFVDDSAKLVTAKAQANASKALEYGCETVQFRQSPVCAEYSGIRSAVEAQAKANEPYAWMDKATELSMITATIGVAASLLFMPQLIKAIQRR